MEHHFITDEQFKQHLLDEDNKFSDVEKQIELVEEERRKRHEEITVKLDKMNIMLAPVFEAFDFKKRLDERGMKAVVRWTKILGFVLLLVAILGYLWSTFKFGVTQIKL